MQGALISQYLLLLITFGHLLSSSAHPILGGYSTKESDTTPDVTSLGDAELDEYHLTKPTKCGHQYLEDSQKGSGATVVKITHSLSTGGLSSADSRNLQSWLSYGTMTIKFDYEQIDKMLESSKPLFFARYFIIKKNLEKVRSYITAYFKVLKLGVKKLPAIKCQGYDIPSTDFEEDLFIT